MFLCRPHLGVGQFRSLARIVQRSLADETLAEQFLAARQCSAGIRQARLGLAQGLCRHGPLHFLELAHPRLRLNHRHVGLAAGSLQFGGLQLNQRVAHLDGLAFDDGNA